MSSFQIVTVRLISGKTSLHVLKFKIGINFLQDQLSPFDCASDPAEKAILNTDSPDFWCQNSLLKLQSLLLSPLCKSPSSGTLSDAYRDIVLSYLEMKEQTIGSLSLRLLCVLDDVKARYEPSYWYRKDTLNTLTKFLKCTHWSLLSTYFAILCKDIITFYIMLRGIFNNI